jgi:hypothetical protein
MKLPIKILFTLALLCPVVVTSAQDNASERRGLDFNERPAIFFMYDRNYSFVDSKLASTSGIKAGLEFSKKLKLGLGYSWLNSDVVEEKKIITEAGTDSSLNARLKLHMGVLYGEYILMDKEQWQFSVPAQLGFGKSYFNYYESVGDGIMKKRLHEEGVVVFNATGMVTYRVLKWFGLSAGAGLRLMVVDNSQLDHNLNGPIFAFRVRIFFGEIYKSFFPNGISGTAEIE